MDAPRIMLFGNLCVIPAGSTCPVKLTRTSQSLLSYLLLNTHSFSSRDQLIELFWKDRRPDRARSCLNSALWRLRQVLESRGIPRGTYLVTTDTGEVGFNWESDHWLDVEHFEVHLEPILHKSVAGLRPDDIGVVEQALVHY